MTKKTFLTSLLIFVSSIAFTQSKTELISQIRKDYKDIRDSLAYFDTTFIEIWDESTEGGQGAGFYSGNQLKFIEVVWLGETGRSMIEYYFKKEKLFFALEQRLDYNRPIYWNDKTAKENGDIEVFDGSKTKITEQRYYFKNEQLFRWLDNDKNEVDLTMGTNTLTGQGLIAHCYKMKDKLKNKVGNKR